jgi:RNA-directed DNA polymerase
MWPQRAGRLLYFVCAFENQADAERFYRALGQRLGKFGLSLSAAKTRVIPFHAAEQTRFDSRSVGFEFYWGKDRQGRDHLKRRTSRKKLRKSLKQFTDWCKQNRHQKLKELFRQLNAKLRGDYNDYGVTGNYESLEQFYDGVKPILLKWLNRRSQRHRFTWVSFQAVLKHFRIERPRIISRPKTRTAASTVTAG